MTYLLALSSLLSRLLGVIRHNRFADVFGAGHVSDAYFAAFQIPDLIYSIIIYGALSAAFVPLFTQYIHKKNTDGAWEFTAAVLNNILVIIISLSIVLFVGAPYFVAILYAGFDVETAQTTIHLIRIMLLSPILFGFSAVFSGIQTAYRHFLFYALAPLLYNLSIIFGIVYLSPVYGIYGVAYGVVAGAFLHALIQLPVVLRFGFRFKPIIGFWRKDMRKLLTLCIPRILGIATLQINLLVEGFIASLGMAGGLTILRYAQDLQSFPIGIVGLSVAVSSFSTLSALALAEDERRSFAKHLSEKIGSVLFLILPASVGMYMLRYPLVKLILESGAFSAADTELTAQILGLLCISLFAASLVPLLSRAFYALENTKTPLYVGLASVILNASLGYYLSLRYGVIGIAIAGVSAALFTVIFLYLLLQKHVSFHTSIYSPKSFARILISTLIMSFVVWMFQSIFTVPQNLVALLLYIGATSIIGIITYFVTAFVLKSPEISRNTLFKKLLRVSNEQS